MCDVSIGAHGPNLARAALQRARRSAPICGFVLAVNVLALIVTLVLSPIFEASPFPLFVIAVALSVQYGGMAAGVFSVIFATLTTDYFFYVPYGVIILDFNDIPRIGLFVLAAIIVSALIAARKQTEERLARLSSAVEQTADNVIITDRRGVVQYVNPAFEALTGYSKSEAVGKTPRILKSGEHNLEFYAQLWTVILSGGVFRDEIVNRRKDGTFYVEEKTITPIKDNDGNITHFVSTGKDITERVHAYMTLERRVEERTLEIVRLYQESELRSRELEALYLADEQLHRHLQLDQVLKALVDVVVDILHADKARVQVLDEVLGDLVVHAARGYSLGTMERMSRYRLDAALINGAFRGDEPIVIEDMRSAPPPANQIAEQEGIQTAVSMPITINGRFFGILGMDYCQARAFTAADKRLFVALAQRAAVAIENAQLYGRAEQAAILVERQRLARELHDSVTQSVYGLTLLAEGGRRMLSAGDIEHGKQTLEWLGETAQHALKEMRMVVHELRPMALSREGLVEALQQRLDAVEARAGVQARLIVDGSVDLPASVEEHIYRFILEALNNALKHSAATSILVRIRSTDKETELEVIDSGKGFNPDAGSSKGGMGLLNMRERSKHIGAEMTIISSLGQGTTIRICLPKPAESKSPGEPFRPGEAIHPFAGKYG